MKLSILPLFLAAAVSASVLPASGDPGEPREPALHFARGDVHIQETVDEAPGVSTQRRFYELYNGDSVEMGRAEAVSAQSAQAIAEASLPASGGTIRWFDPAAATW